MRAQTVGFCNLPRVWKANQTQENFTSSGSLRSLNTPMASSQPTSRKAHSRRILPLNPAPTTAASRHLAHSL
ncbi:hypothetical protein GYMLUDRAFT_95047 [Collybiopsis luxurians FD-317 M1]|uniref:Uncharacterized protein n=1 Tax=Collybiopsis luxurians FD-317 M1 TaxID=944289 RepID=A0A0D0BJ21_9AGAR|nr:hypothetical protein GYMLUDRAFT_95047 [Collybiopsis luxurians FD-317 M1]